MASAILPSKNQPSWSDYGSKFTNSNLNFTGFDNVIRRNPNPNPSHFFISDASRDDFGKNRQQLSSSAPPAAAFTGSLIDSVPANSSGQRYITFRLSSYTRRELKELKKRLKSDLDRVRDIRHWICSTPVPKKDYHPPPAELPPAPGVALTVKESQKSAVGQKRTKPLPAVRDTKKHCCRVKSSAQRSKMAMRKCGQILGKLMKHKHGWVFNTPVDVVSLKLYDYHNVIKNPMDLGTIKLKLGKNEYESPLAFASDVRLTFQNAMVYNGPGSDVFIMAERLLSLFEDLFNPTHQKFIGNQSKKQNRPVNPVKPLVSVLPHVAVLPSDPNVANLGKPREMTVEEKSELAACLLSSQLGQEGMDQIMASVKKGVLGMEHQGDEIELDLGVLDNDTLWELHSFIGGTNKKAKENSEMEMVSSLVSSLPAINSPVSEQEDIDIGEEIPVSNFPSVEIEKDSVNVSSSSSGSGSSGSSSGSGSSSSSGGSGSDSDSGDEEKGKSMGILGF